MKRRTRRKGYLIQKSQPREIAPNDLSSRHAPEGRFRITAITQNATKAWIVGEYQTFKEAKERLDNFPESGVDYYVHGNSSRVLYSKKGNA